MLITRRTFLQSAAVGAALTSQSASAAATHHRRAQSSMRILVLGGTGFIGPHVVRRAVERGHTVTLFNRGRSNTHLFPNVEKLRGDRNGQLDSLRGRTWDVVIDNTGYVPQHVRDSAELLRDSVGHYFFTSTVDAYRDYHVAGIDETYPLATMPPGEPHDPRRYYGPLKSVCEDVVREVYPDHFTIMRPGWVAGPGDNNHLFTYWTVRVDRGGEVLAPGTPDDPMQITDVRDMAHWVIQMVEARDVGSYNLVGPVMTMAEMLYGIRAVTSANVSFTWVSADFLLEQGVQGWTHIPLWWPPDNDYGERTFGGNIGGVGALNLDGSLARSKGFRQRPLADTARETLEWYHANFDGWPEDQRPGLSRNREAEILRAWHARTSGD